MNHQRAFLYGLGAVFIFLAAAVPALAQQEQKPLIEPSYEAALQVVVGSDQNGGDVPQALSPITRQLRSTFGFAGYRLANTFIGRFSTGGTIEYKSVGDIYGQPQESAAPNFLDWSMSRLRVSQDERGQAVMQSEVFRFGARVPVLVGQPTSNAISYEGIGLTTSRLSVPVGKPTLVGTLSLPKTAGTLFLVLTVRPVEN